MKTEVTQMIVKTSILNKNRQNKLKCIIYQFPYHYLYTPVFRALQKNSSLRKTETTTTYEDNLSSMPSSS